MCWHTPTLSRAALRWPCRAPPHPCAAPHRAPARPCTANRSLAIPCALYHFPRSPGNWQRPRVLAPLSHGGSGRPRHAVGLPPSTPKPPPPLLCAWQPPPSPRHTHQQLHAPASAPRGGPLSLRLQCALRQSRASPRRSPPQRRPMLCPDAALRCAPAKPSTAPLLSPARQPYNIRPCSPPSRPCTAPPRVPARCPCAAPRGALAEP